MPSPLKRKTGRPPTGLDPVIATRLPADLIARIEGYAARYEGMTRSVAIRCLIELGLLSAPKATASDPKNSGSYRRRARGGWS